MKKQIKGNVMTVKKDGWVIYTTSDGFKVEGWKDTLDRLGERSIIGAVQNLADNSVEGLQLAQKFENWLRKLEGKEPEQEHSHPNSLFNL